MKLENVLLTADKKGQICIKIIDFGCSDYYTSGEQMTNFTGSIFYIAPEVIWESYTEKCDIWSIGVIAYSLLAGVFPFDDKEDENIAQKILQTKLKFHKSMKKVISRKCRKFLKKLLKKNYEHRLTAQQALNHSWYTQNDN